MLSPLVELLLLARPDTFPDSGRAVTGPEAESVIDFILPMSIEGSSEAAQRVFLWLSQKVKCL